MEIPTTVEFSNYDAGVTSYYRGHYDAALYDFEQRAVQGDPVAQFCLAFMYKHGKGVPQNFQNAIEWYIKSAEQGYVPAQNDLGVIYGQIGERALIVGDEPGIMNFKQAQKWFTEAGGQGNPTALFNAGLVCKLFADLTMNSTEDIDLYSRVVSCFKMAAKQNYAPAQNDFGMIYQNGLWGVVKNLEKALELFKKAATPYPDTASPFKNGYAPAQHNLAITYANGIGVKQDFKEALKWFQKAAEQGVAESQFSLGLSYYKGDGVKQDFKEAANWYQKAAQQGNSKAQTNLAIMYIKGEEVPKNSEKAARLTLAAAQQGSILAQASLGKVFEKEPEALFQDDAEAYYWYSLAIQDKVGLNAGKNANLVLEVSEGIERLRNILTKEQRDRIDARVNKWVPRVLHASGTGFYINEKHLLTNAHVLRWRMNTETNMNLMRCVMDYVMLRRNQDP